ncbi:hypothetical protein PIB30_089946 [Stylosanthes scabra]|uniref:Uncharacterized protein n=1 Tax=Stylosanthes scabra TaxID=79078 RepID=A0ABU6QTJ7_9FABA|nr:hypothetical protein [Stylosanthes scabra]
MFPVLQDFQLSQALLLSKLNENASQVCTMKSILGQQGEVLEVLANRVAVLEGSKKPTSKCSGAAQKGTKASVQGKGLVSAPRPSKRKLDFVDLTDDDIAILYLIHQME